MTENTINNDMTMGDAAATLLAGRYRVVRQLGQGGMGSVWLAEDTKLDGFKVAIKMLPSVLVNNKWAYAQVKAEALVSLKLSHPNIATVRAFEEESGSPFLVMDYIDGQTLDDYLAEKGKLTEEETVKLLKPVAAALDYAHTQGVVHRDVKPGNIMIRKDGTPFVLDFGIAREIQETMTRVTGKLSSGTLLYMSPEQLHGAEPSTAQDVYSFSALAYECLSGRPPFCRGQIEHQIVNDVPTPLPDGIRIRKTLAAGLSKTPVDRPTSCFAVLTSAVKKSGWMCPSPELDQPQRSFRLLPAVLISGLAVVVAVAGAWIFWTQRESRRLDELRSEALRQKTALCKTLADFVGLGYSTLPGVMGRYHEMEAAEQEGSAALRKGEYGSATNAFQRARVASEWIASVGIACRRCQEIEEHVRFVQSQADTPDSRKLAKAELERAARHVAHAREQFSQKRFDASETSWKMAEQAFKHVCAITRERKSCEAQRAIKHERERKLATGYVVELQGEGLSCRWVPGRIQGDIRTSEIEGVLEMRQICATCHGRKTECRTNECLTCRGTGHKDSFVTCHSCHGNRTAPQTVTCLRCKGNKMVTTECNYPGSRDASFVYAEQWWDSSQRKSMGLPTGKLRGHILLCPECQGFCHDTNGRQVKKKTGSFMGIDFVDAEMALCSRCKGYGYVRCPGCGGGGIMSVDCPKCSGRGSWPEDRTCSVCSGTGKEKRDEPCSKCENGKQIESVPCAACAGEGFEWKPIEKGRVEWKP